MNTTGLFDMAAEAVKDREFRLGRDARNGVTDSLFKSGSRVPYHKSDEHYPAERADQLYPGLVVEVVIANPYSRVESGHVESVLTRVHSINNFGVPGRIMLGVGGYVNFDDLRKPITCYPQRHAWGVVGDRVVAHLNSGKNVHGTLADVDDLEIHASKHSKVRVFESQPNLPAKKYDVFVGQLSTKKDWLGDLSNERVREQLTGQYPQWWQSPDGTAKPVLDDTPKQVLDDTQNFVFAQAQRLRLLGLKMRLKSITAPKAAKREVIRPEHLYPGAQLRARNLSELRKNFWFTNIATDHDGVFTVQGNPRACRITPTTQSRFKWNIQYGKGKSHALSLNGIRQLFELVS